MASGPQGNELNEALPALAARTDRMRALLRLAIPLSATHVGFAGLGLVDTWVAGRAGSMVLGAVSMGNTIHLLFMLVGMGTLMGLDPLLAQALGANDGGAIRSLVRLGFRTAFGLTLVSFLPFLAVPWILERFGIEPELAEQTFQYLTWRLPGAPAMLCAIVTQSFLQAKGNTRPLLVSIAVANVFNLAANWLLTFGGEATLGPAFAFIPPLGARGLGLASALATWAMLGVHWATVRRRLAEMSESPPVMLRDARRLLVIGVPIGLQFLAEVGGFSIVTLLAGQAGPVQVAAHQIALTLASTTFSACIGIAKATSVFVGRAVGARDALAMRAAGLDGIVLTTAFMLMCAAVFALFPGALARAFSTDPAVIGLGVNLLLIAAAFQVGDGLQCVASAALRGMGDTRISFVANAIGYYVVGLPVGIALQPSMGVAGLWYGLSAGLFVVALWLTVRFVLLSRMLPERV